VSITSETRTQKGMHNMIQMLKTYMDAHWYREEGATAVEYGIMVAAIAAVIIAIVIVLGGQINTAFTKTSTELTKVVP
jgi:pilus assembly protein Flp/PilA